MAFEYTELSAPVTINWYRGEIDISERIRATERSLIEQMNQSLYSDDAKPTVRLSRTQRLLNKAALYKTRIIDAWDVLRGRAEVGSY